MENVTNFGSEEEQQQTRCSRGQKGWKIFEKGDDVLRRPRMRNICSKRVNQTRGKANKFLSSVNLQAGAVYIFSI